MKRLILTFLSLIILQTTVFSQPANKFSTDQLKSDLHFLENQIYSVHAYPYTELNQQQYKQLFTNIESKLTDSLNAVEYFKLIRPCFAYLSDEHAGLSVPEKILPEIYKTGTIYLPFTLLKEGNKYTVSKILVPQNGLAADINITSINGVPVDKAVEQASLMASGYKDQRMQKALDQFGLLYSRITPGAVTSYVLKTNDGKSLTITGVAFSVWQTEINRQTGWNSKCDELISYRKYGNTGYITSCSFTASDRQLDSINTRLQAIFKQVKDDGVSKLVIDVSHNGGGNSSVGQLLINYIYGKPYNGYQCNFKRSDDYLKLIKSWGLNNPEYEARPVGTIIHSNSEKITPDVHNPYRFNGKVYIVIGDGTFSSAIMFATTIKDNHIATLVGKIPDSGHPDHFGEMYNNVLPNTKLPFRFGVKEWIRPTGKSKDNVLRPDKIIDMDNASTPEKLIAAID
ncbi:S41 family peptidase [Mucilaginibacter sp. KACC 22063]|uniref:S41 family peptidase n=1 Tax=Mucilaginibacter sp. KACC 22063 TaxID=3025666 RepID=UPI002365A683|nr:S41 family peptidase [Mucilaginibacter sp. KACC 22063]WDF54982.1 S41 family peptidase [Mucilaginibacter sp. KACC 22063]